MTSTPPCSLSSREIKSDAQRAEVNGTGSPQGAVGASGSRSESCRTEAPFLQLPVSVAVTAHSGVLA